MATSIVAIGILFGMLVNFGLRIPTVAGKPDTLRALKVQVLERTPNPTSTPQSALPEAVTAIDPKDTIAPKPILTPSLKVKEQERFPKPTPTPSPSPSPIASLNIVNEVLSSLMDVPASN